MLPPRLQLGTPLERGFGAEARQHVSREEHRRRQRAIGQRKLRSGCESARREHRFKLIQALIEFGQPFVDDFLVAALGVELAEQRAQWRLKVEVVKTSERPHSGAIL